MRHLSRRPVAVWAACLAVGGLSSAAVTPLGAATPRAATRITILYDAAATLRTMLGPGKLDPEGDNLYQQIPARGVLPPARQAEKASSRKPVYVSRSLRELDGAQMTQVLRQLIDASPAHLVFIDEASDPVFVGPFADELGTALAALAATPFDDGSTTYATHVHAYVYGSGQMISDPGPRDGIWKALTLMGGVWLETFEGADRTGGRPAAKPWSEATWASRPPAFARMFARRGGNLSRLHFLMSSGRPGDQPLEWALASAGRGPYSPCRILANGPGAYRLGAVPGSARAWVREYRRVFPTTGGATLRCR